jgi:hypothetical protein
METTLQEIVIPEKVSDKARVRLPKVGSRLYKTLAMLAELDEPNSGEVAARLQARGERFTVSEASTCLTVLMGMKLVYRVHARKNLPGGSVWALTDECTDLMEQPDGT